VGAFVTTLVGLAAGLLLAAAVRALVPAARHLSWPTAILLGVVGAGAGVGLARAIDRSVLVAVAVALVTTAVALVIGGMVRRRLRPDAPPRSTAELLAAGESEAVEFKSSARRNLHSGKRDEHIEHVIVKTVAGFLNGRGGTLLIGVDDHGQVIGLDADYPLMKAPTDDAYELWLRDYLGSRLGTLAVATVHVGFEDVDGHRLCRIDVPPSSTPVYLTPPKSHDRELWVRAGNTTRHLRTDEAVEYHRRRWG
jgi:hypothetical protein